MSEQDQQYLDALREDSTYGGWLRYVLSTGHRYDESHEAGPLVPAAPDDPVLVAAKAEGLI